MSWLEWVLLAWLGLAALLGWRAGFVFTAGNLVGFFVSLWMTRKYGSHVAQWVGGGPWGYILACVGVVIVVTKLGGVLAMLLDKIVKVAFIIPFIKTFNRLLGGLLSVATHLMIASLVAFLIHSIILEPLVTQPWTKAMVSLGSLLAGALPHTLQRYL